MSSAIHTGLSLLATTPTTDWVDETTAFVPNNFGTVTSSHFFTRRVGDTLEVRGEFVSGTSAAAAASITLPSKYVIDASKVTTNSNALGLWFWLGASGISQIFSASNSSGTMIYDGSDTAKVYYANTEGTTNGVFNKVNASTIHISGQVSSIQFRVPISGWSSGGGASSIYSLSDWTAYTPVTQGLGTLSAVGFYYRRVGDSLQIQAKMTLGTRTGSQIQIGLPSGLVIDSSKTSSSQLVGDVVYSGAASGVKYDAIATGGNAYLNISFNGNGSFVLANGTDLFADATTISLIATAPISGWTSTSSGSLTAPRSEVAVDTGNGNGSTNTKIRRFTNIVKNVGSAITYADSATLGGSFTINEPGVYAVSYSDFGGAGGDRLGVSINVDATRASTDISSVTYAQGYRILDSNDSTSGGYAGTAWTGNLNAGDIVRAHGSGTMNGTGTYVLFTIAKVSN